MHMEAEHLYPTRILDQVLKPLISIKLISDYSLQCSVFIVPSLVNIYKRQQSILYIQEYRRMEGRECKEGMEGMEEREGVLKKMIQCLTKIITSSNAFL